MMENYQETSTSNNQIEQTKVLNQVETVTWENFGAVTSKEENYNFGAEVTKTITPKQVDVDDDGDEKAENTAKTTTAVVVESITSTKTETDTETEQILAPFAVPPEFPCASSAATLTPIDSAIGSEQYDTADDIGDDEDRDDVQERRAQQFVHNQATATHIGEGSTAPVDSSDDDTSTSTDSDFSDISGLSDVSGKEWKPVTRKPILWVQKQIHSGRNPRELLSRFLPAGAQSIALGLNDMSLWRLLANMLSEPPRRQKLRHINTFEDVIQLILRSENIVVLTGAGVSVSCGIPDFRSSDGIYSRLAKDYPNLPDPQAMFDIDYFSRDPRPFYKFAREIYPGQFKPSPCHRFIKLLEEKQRLLRNYTQNIDTLEQVAGIKRVIECHGSFSTASCTKCKYKCDAEAIRADIFAQRIPACPRCQPNVQQSVDAAEPVSEYDLRLLVANGIMKPDIVFFGEGLPEEFHKVMASDKDKCDLLIVIGSSLKVRPVALIPSSLPANVPQILINREQLNHLEFDVELLGDSDVIINQICHRLGDDWKEICFDEQVLQEAKELRPLEDDFEDEIPDCDDVENDDDTRQLQDVDTQSIKSNVSAECLGFRSAGACSDSGFESSTSLGQTEHVNKTLNDKIEDIKSSLLDYSDGHKITSNEKHDFQPFSVRSEQETAAEMTPPPRAACSDSTLRHLSIDSTKDSGIQCDSSSSMVTNVATFNETATSSNSTAPKAIKTPTAITELEESQKRRRKSRSCSAADYLIEGTYYYHKNSCSYVFPGAQISWYTDSDSDLDDGNDDDENTAERCENNEDDDNATDDLDTKCDEGNCSQDSQECSETIYMKSVDVNVNGATSSTETITRVSNCYKRRSSVDRFYKSVEEVNVTKTFTRSHDCEHICDETTTPTKKRRINEEEIAASCSNSANVAPARAILTTTINTHTSNSEHENNTPQLSCNISSSLQLESTSTAPSTALVSVTSTTTTTTTETLQDI